MTAPRFTLMLACAGAAIAWFPFAATVAISAAATVVTGRLLFDWLMPAELFPAFVVGAALLVWAARRAGRRGTRGLVVGALEATAALVASQAAAVATGLASGATPARGRPLVLVVALFLLYIAGALAVAVMGTGLVRDLLRRSRRG